MPELIHDHNEDCLPSASLDDEGQLLVDAEDLYKATPGCFFSCMRRLYCQVSMKSLLNL